MRAFHRSRSVERFLTICLLLLPLVALAPASAAAHSASSASNPASPPRRLPEPASVVGDGAAGLHGNAYAGYDFPFSVRFDADVRTSVKPYEREDGYEGFSIKSDATIGAIGAVTDADTVFDCHAASIAGLGHKEGFSNVHQAPELAVPASAAGVDAAMFTFDISFGEDVTPYTSYVECRDLVQGKSVLRTELAEPNIQFDDALPMWEPLLNGITVAPLSGDAPAGTDAGATGTPPPDDPDIESLTGSTYTSTRFGFSVSWRETYEPTAAFYDQKTDGDMPLAERGRTSLYLTPGAIEDYSVADCFDFSESLITSGTNTNVRLMNDAGGQPMRSVSNRLAYALYAYTVNASDGSGDLVEYVQCQADPTGTFTLDFSFMTAAPSYAKTSADLKTILDSIQFA